MTNTRVPSLALAGGLLLGTLAAAGVGVGDKAPDFNPDQWWNARAGSLGKLAGKAILLEFFATW